MPQTWDASILVPAMIRTIQKLEARIAFLEGLSGEVMRKALSEPSRHPIPSIEICNPRKRIRP